MKNFRSLRAILCCALLVLTAAQLIANTPTFVLNSPASGGTGSHALFTFSVTDSAGVADIAWANLSFGGTGAGSCLIAWQAINNRVLMLADDGVNYFGPYTISSFGNTVPPATMQNSKCSLAISTSYISSIGNTLSIVLDVTFKPGFNAGPIYIIAGDQGFNNSGWQQVGTWNAVAPGIPSISMVGSGGTGTHQVFTFNVTDSGGAGDIGWVGAALGTYGAGGCQVTWQRVDNRLLLANDQANGYIGPATLGIGSILGNTQCSVAAATSSKSESGNVLTLNLDVTLNGSTFAGTRPVYGIAGNLNSGNNGWVSIGSWTIPSQQDEYMITTRESVQPLDPGELGAPRVILSQANSISGSDALSVYHANDPVQFTITNTKPNTQVWARRTAFDSAATYGNYLLAICTADNGQENQANFDVLNGACYLGTTDSNGFFVWNGHIYAGVNGTFLGATTVQFYVGPQAFNPNDAHTTNGPMNEDNYIGALTYWVTGTNGLPVPAWQ